MSAASVIHLTPVQREQVRRLAKAAEPANRDAGFKYLKLCEPSLVLAMIAGLRELCTVPVAELDRMAALAAAAAGKRATSDEGFAFVEAAEPSLIHAWCRDLLAAL